MKEPTFQMLLDVHRALDELFFEHQAALLAIDFASAREKLDEYHGELLGHMEFEEDILLPVYRRAGVIPGGPEELFTGEHARMLEFLERFKSTMAGIDRQPDPVRSVISLLDDEAVFKNLCQHHDQRERNIFFPALDRVTSIEERAALLNAGLAANSELLERQGMIRAVDR